VPQNATIFRKLLIRHAHRVTEHASFDRTLAEIRTTLHTQFINDEIRTSLQECLRCQIAKIVCDRASYFASNRFAQECYDRLGARVESLSARSPFEGGAFEKLHDLGLERLRHMTASQQGKVKGLAPRIIQDLLDRVTLFLNTRPLHRVHKPLPDSEVIEPLTPEEFSRSLLAFRLESIS
jgi:hypothetical protein